MGIFGKLFGGMKRISASSSGPALSGAETQSAELMLTCPSTGCGQHVVLVAGYGSLGATCPRCGTDLQPALASAKAGPWPAGERALSLDGAEMVYVPAGPFLMGSDLPEVESAFDSACREYGDVMWVWFEREVPRRTVVLPGFWIDVVPVTCARYKRFCDATGHQPPEYWSGGEIPAELSDHPVVDVTWEDTLAYFAWAGKRGPYESEWEKAARGSDGRAWPWGSEYREDCGNIDRGLDTGTKPVGSFPQGASPYGCLDMAGNVFEWTRDICVPYPGYAETDQIKALREQRMRQSSVRRTTVFADGVAVEETQPFQFYRGVVRGGAWGSCAGYCRTTFRLEPHGPGSRSIGFRCVLGEDPCGQSKDLVNQREYQEALACAERSLALSPNYPTALYNAAQALQGLHRDQEVAACYRHLLSVWPTDQHTWNQLGQCLTRIGDVPGAIAAFDAAINTGPFNADYWCNKAQVLRADLVRRLTQSAADEHVPANEVHYWLPDHRPVSVVQALAELHAEAAGCFTRARRLGAEDNDVVTAQAGCEQQAGEILEHLRSRMDRNTFLRATARLDFCRSFPTVQHVWAIIRHQHLKGDFTYQPMLELGLGEMEASTGLTYLKEWGRIETVGFKTFRVIRTDGIDEYDPCNEHAGNPATGHPAHEPDQAPGTHTLGEAMPSHSDDRDQLLSSALERALLHTDQVMRGHRPPVARRGEGSPEPKGRLRVILGVVTLSSISSLSERCHKLLEPLQALLKGKRIGVWDDDGSLMISEDGNVTKLSVADAQGANMSDYDMLILADRWLEGLRYDAPEFIDMVLQGPYNRIYLVDVDRITHLDPASGQWLQL